MGRPKISDSYDSQVYRFLVRFCNEGEDHSALASILRQAYVMHHSEVVDEEDPHARKVMSQSSLLNRLKGYGYEVSMMPVGMGGWDKRVLGVALKPDVLRDVLARLDAQQDEDRPVQRNRHNIIEFPAKGLHSHVRVKDDMYDRALIATFRRIRGFKNAQGVEFTHIVTFHNAEMRHQFLTSEQAEILQQDLGAAINCKKEEDEINS